MKIKTMKVGLKVTHLPSGTSCDACLPVAILEPELLTNHRQRYDSVSSVTLQKPFNKPLFSLGQNATFPKD
jgi:hypothetical protein